MRQIKRLFKASVLLLCCLLLASCAPQRAQENTPVTLTALQYELENQVINFSDMWFYDQLEDETNVHVDFVDVKDADWVTRISLMFASRNYTDMILRGPWTPRNTALPSTCWFPWMNTWKSICPTTLSGFPPRLLGA